MEPSESKRVRLVIDKSSTPKTHRPQKDSQVSEKSEASEASQIYLKVSPDIDVEVTNVEDEQKRNIVSGNISATTSDEQPSKISEMSKLEALEDDEQLSHKETIETSEDFGSFEFSASYAELDTPANKEIFQHSTDGAPISSTALNQDIAATENGVRPKKHGCLISILSWTFVAILAFLYGGYTPIHSAGESLLFLVGLTIVVLILVPFVLGFRWLLNHDSSLPEKKPGLITKAIKAVIVLLTTGLTVAGLLLNTVFIEPVVQPLELDASYTYEGITIKYPSSWWAPIEDGDGFYIANKNEPMGIVRVEVHPGFFSTTDTSEDLLRSKLYDYWRDTDGLTLLTTEDEVVSGYPAKKASFVFDLNGTKTNGFGLNLFTEARLYLVIAASSPDNAEDKATMKAIIESINVNE